MADPTMTLVEYLRKMGVDLDGDFLSQGTQLLAQLAIEFEAEERVSASRYPRSPSHWTYRNGHRERLWETGPGEIPLLTWLAHRGRTWPDLTSRAGSDVRKHNPTWG